MNTIRRNIIDILIIAGGILARFYPLLTRRFIGDELWTYRFATMYPSYWLHFISPIDDRPPLYYFFTHAQAALATHEAALRFPSGLASIAAFLIPYFFFRSKNRTAATAILLLLSFSLLLIDLSWIFRDYGLIMLATSCILVVAYRCLEQAAARRHPWNLYVLLGLLGLIGSMINYLLLPFLLSIVCASAVLAPGLGLKSRMKTGGMILLALLPAFLACGGYLYFQQVETIINTTHWIPWPTLPSVSLLIIQTAGISGFLGERIPDGRTVDYVIRSVAVIGLIGGMFMTVRMRKHSMLQSFSMMCFLVFVVNVMIIYILSLQLDRSLFLPRTFTPAVITFLFGLGIVSARFIETVITPSLQKSILGICAFLYFLSFATFYVRWYSQPDFTQQMLTTVETVWKSGDQIFFFPVHDQFLYLPYFWRNRASSSYNDLALHVISRHTQDVAPTAHPALAVPFQIIFVVERDFQQRTLKNTDSLSFNRDVYADTTEYCAGSPKEIFADDAFFVYVCTVTDTPSASQ